MKQMGVIFLIVYLCLLSSVSYAGEAEEWMKTIRQSEGDAPYSEAQIRAFLKKAEPILQKESDNLYFYMVLGDFVKMLHGYYYDKVFPNYHLNAPESQALIKEYQSYYQKAMALDDNPDAPNHLSVSMLSSIGMDSVGDPAIKVRALEKAAALARAGKNPGGSEMFEWNTYEARLDIYVDAKDYDNALKIVDEMIDRFGSNEELEGYKRHFEEMIAKRDNAAAMVEDTYAQAEPYTEPIEEVAAEPQAVEPYTEPIEVAETSKPAPVAKVAKPKLEPQADTQESNVMLWLLGGVALLLGLTGLLRRKNKG